MTQRRLRFGILGTARIARTFFIPGVIDSQLTEVVAVASRDPHRAQAMATEMGIPRAHASYEALLADPDLDAVYVPLPNSLHAEWTIAAAQAGKHVLCEKPLAGRVADAERMVAACQAAGVVLMEGFMWRHHPQHARVQQLVRDGALGDPTFLRSTFCYVINPEQPSGPNVRLRSELEGGSLMDVGCYGVNAARMLFDDEPVAAVGQQALDAAFGVETAFAGVLRFAGDRLAVVDSSFFRSPTNTYVLEGSQGSLQAERAFRPDADAARIRVTRNGKDPLVEEVPPANQFANEVDHFARSVENGRLLPPAEDGLAQARVMEALYASAVAGQTITLA